MFFIGVFMIVILLSLLYYVGINIWAWFYFGFGKTRKWYVLLIFLLFPIIYILSHSSIGNPVFRFLGVYWIVFFQYAILSFPILNFVVYVLSKKTSIAKTKVVQWSGFTFIAFFCVVLGLGTFNAYSPVVRTYDVTIDKSANGLKELNVVMASDMHFGLLSGKSHAQNMVDEINKLQPDLIVFPGDIIDDTDVYFDKYQIAAILSKLKAPLGVYGTIGNHDLRGGRESFLNNMKESGISILTDETVNIGDHFILSGREDNTNKKRKSLQEILHNIPNDDLPIILMDHQPNRLNEAKDNGVDLILSGHTHYGQMGPNQFITHLIFENDWGYLKKGSLQSIVSSGYGFWGPAIRIGSRSEIVQINITFLHSS